MLSFSRGVLFLLVLLVAGLPLHCSAALDAEERQKEREEHKAATEGVEKVDMAPERPQELKVDVQSESVVLLTWNAPSDTTDLDHYLVYVEDEDMEDTTTSIFYVWYDLEACTNYTFGVRSVSALGDMSDPELGKGLTDVERPPVPQNVQAETKSSTSVTLTWDKPDTLCDVSYQVSWSLDGLDTQSTQVNKTSCTVSNLLPNTTYVFKVFAFTSEGMGDPVIIEETTSEEEGGPPENLKAVGFNESAIYVSWSPPPYKTPLYYTVQGQSCHPLQDIVSELSFDITGRPPCEVCTITVTSVYDNDITYAAVTNGETLSGDPPPPKNCSVNVQDIAVTVNWLRPDSKCAIGDYHLQWTVTKLWGDGEEESNSSNASGLKYSIYDPVPYSDYSFNISASIDDVFGSPASCRATSLETWPGPPVILDVVSEQGAVVVTWETPSEENGLITIYGIFIDDEDQPVTNVTGDKHNASVVNLEPCVSVGLTVKAQNGAGWGASSEKKYVTVVDDVVPEKVECDAHDLGVQACWLPYSDSCPVSRYILKWEGDVLWSDDLVDSNSTTMDWSNDEICYNISALPYTKYSVELTVGSGSQAVTCSAVTPMAAPGPPTDVNVTTKDLVIGVSWSEPDKKNGIIDFYRVKWEDSNGGTGNLTTPDNSTFYLEIQEPSCGVTVNVTVLAKVVTVDELGDASPPVTAYIVNSVKELSCASSTPGQVSLNWTLVDAECPVGFYNVTWIYDSLWSDDTGGGCEVVKQTNSTTLTSLPAYSNVILQIHIDNNPEYKQCSINTPEEASSQPTSVMQVASSSSSVTVAWGLPLSIRGVLKGWHLIWKTMNGNPIQEVEIKDTEEMTYEITELSPSSSYVVYVMAINGAGDGEAEKISVTTAFVSVPSSTNKGLIIGLSVGSGILLILLLVGGFVLYRKKSSSKPPSSVLYTPEVVDADSDELYKMQNFSSTNHTLHNKSGSVGFDSNNELYMNARPSLSKDKLDAGNEIPPAYERGPMFAAPPNRRLSQQVSTTLPTRGAYNRRPSQQVNSRMRSYEEYNRRPSQQDMISRPSLSGGPGRPSLGEYGKRLSQQADLGRPMVAGLGRRPSQQTHTDRPFMDEFARRPSQQAPAVGGSFPTRLPQQGPSKRSSVDLYSRRPSQQAEFARPGDMRRPSQQFVMNFEEIKEL